MTKKAGDVFDPELIEQLAEIEHEKWSEWHRYARTNWDKAHLERWNRQAVTSYKALSEEEKESDRLEVRRYLPVILSWLRANGMKP